MFSFRTSFKKKKTTEKQVGTLTSLDLANEKDELKQIEVYFHKIRWMVWFMLS